MDIKQNIEDILKWIEELRSGNYSQGRRSLHQRNPLNQSESFCCLGVACKVLIEPVKLSLKEDGTIGGYYPSSQQNAPEWLKYIDTDFISKTNASFSALNDYGVLREVVERIKSDFPYYEASSIKEPFTFDEIADLLVMVYVLGVLDEEPVLV